jgi:hypothetical protein
VFLPCSPPYHKGGWISRVNARNISEIISEDS